MLDTGAEGVALLSGDEHDWPSKEKHEEAFLLMLLSERSPAELDFACMGMGMGMGIGAARACAACDGEDMT